MQKADPLLRTKLRLPIIRPGFVRRARLQEQLERGVCGPLTLITAPAGFGKTTLAAAFVAGWEMTTAWLSLDKEDNQPGRFLRYLIAALHQADPALGSEAAQLAAAGQPSEAPLPEAVLTSLMNDLDCGGCETVLVLDDYQFISSQAVHEQVAFLLEHCPHSFHVVIATRSDPPLPLARLRGRGQVMEIRAADLRFTAGEAAQFLNDSMGLQLDAEWVAVLEERTEGWIAGLQMAALSMRDRADVAGFIQGFSGTNRHILDYLLEEVLRREPEEVQTFLLQTSVLNRLSGPLCDAVTGASGGQEMLERLEKRNLFLVPLDDERRWYRYHHLFADLLQARLYQAGAEAAKRLLSGAAGWCEREGRVIDAVGYALASRDYTQAAGLVEKYWGPVLNSGEVETVWSWLAALPEEVLRNSARLSLAACWVLWLRGQTGAIEPHLIHAERALNEPDSSQGFEQGAEDYALLPAQLAALRSFVTRYHDDFVTARTQAERALRLIPEDLPPPVNAQLRSIIFLAVGSAYDGTGDLEQAVEAYAESIRFSRQLGSASGIALTYRQSGALRLLGRLRAAEATCREALEYMQAQGMGHLPATGILHVAMSEVLVEQNELAAAEAHLSQGLKLGKGGGRLDAVRNTAFVLARLRLIRQDAGGALAAVQEAEQAAAPPVPPQAMAELLAMRARVLVRQGAVSGSLSGSLSEAERCAQEAVRLASHDRGQTGQLAALAALRVQCAAYSSKNRPDEAAARLTEALRAAEEAGWWGAAMELRILRSLALAEQAGARREDTKREALADLEQALALAEPEGYVRIFLDEGPPMRALLAQWLAQAGDGPRRDFGSRLLAQFEGGPQAAAGAQEAGAQGGASPGEAPGEQLTRREVEVLRLLADGLSNRQIAEELVLSEGTVKFYVHTIMEKLGVHSRTQALRAARERKLV